MSLVCHFQANHHRALMNFVEAQAQYYAQCHAYMTELQKQLARYSLTHFIFQYLNSGEEGLSLLPMDLARALGFGRYCKVTCSLTHTDNDKLTWQISEHLLEMSQPCVYGGHERQLVLLSAVQVSFQRSSFFSTRTLVIRICSQNIGTIW